MEKIARFTAQERENLTAYLDGELEETLAADIELKLSRSEVARRDVEILSRTWDMLGMLPRGNASGEFSRKTMAVAQQAEEPVLLDRAQHLAVGGKKLVLVAGWLLAIGLAASVGYRITNQFVPDSSRLLVEDLPIIENLDNYREIGDIEFLRQLQTSRVFQEEAVNAPAP